MYSVYIDRSGMLQEAYREDQLLDNYLYILCTQGACSVNIYNSQHTITANTLIALLPNNYFKINSQDADTVLYVVSFKHVSISSINLFAKVMKHITLIIESPILALEPVMVDIMCDYIKLLMRINSEMVVSDNIDFTSSIFTQFVIMLWAKYKLYEGDKFHADRSKVLVMKVLKLISSHYRGERSATFYAQKMNVSPQHLSTIVRKVTNRTLTDLISMFVIIDAQNQLVSTDLSIGEIAAALSFDDISVFSRYFKRYTMLSPRQYRSLHLY